MDESMSEDKLDTSRSSTSEEATSPRPKVPYALHINLENKENDKGESKPSTPRNEQNKNVTKKPQTPTESTHHTLRAPWAQPVLDASKHSESKKSSVEERLASAKERRLQHQRQLDMGLKSLREKEDQAHAKWIQTMEDKRRRIEESRTRDDQHRKEVEMRKKQQLEEDKKRAEAKIARTDQVYEVKMRQKRSTSTDRSKRWSWGAGAGGGGGGGGGRGDCRTPFDYFDPTRMTKRMPSTDKKPRPRSMHASHYDVSELGRLLRDGDDQKSASHTNLSSPSLINQPSETGRFSKSPLVVNTTHMAFASGLRSYDSGSGKGVSPDSPGRQRSSSIGARPRKTEKGGPVRAASMEHIPTKKEESSSEPTPTKTPTTRRGRSPMPKVTLTTTARIREQLAKNQKGRLSTSSGLTEPVSISPRLLAPTRASLARSRNAVNEIDDAASQSSNDSKSHGPMRSRSKDRRSPMAARPNTAKTSPRSDTASNQTPERKSTPTRGTSPMVPNRRAPSPALTAPTAASEARRTTPVRSTSVELSKPKRGTSPAPQSRPLRAPSPASRTRSSDSSHTTPTRTTPRRAPSPSPATSKTKTKVQNDSPKTAPTPPNIKPSLHSASGAQVKSKSSPSTKPAPAKTSKPAKTKAKSDTSKPIQKAAKPTEKKQKPPEKERTSQQQPPKLNQEKQPTSNPVVKQPTTSSVESPKTSNETPQQTPAILAHEVEKQESEADKTVQKEETNTIEAPIPAVTEDVQPAPDIKKTDDSARIDEVQPEAKDFANINEVPQSEEEKSEPPQMEDQKTSISTENQENIAPEPLIDIPQHSEAPKTAENVPSGAANPPEIILAAKSGFHLEQESESQDILQEAENIPPENIQQDSLTSFQSMDPVDPRAVSPTDSLEEVSHEPEEIPQSQSLQQEMGEADIPQPDSFDEESSDESDPPSVKERIPETKETAGEADKSPEAPVVAEVEPTPEAPVAEEPTETVQKEDEESMEKSAEPKPVAKEEPAAQPAEDSAVETTNNQTTPSPPAETVQVKSQTTKDEPPPVAEVTQTAPDNGQSTEKKSQPRKNLETEEELEAYRQAIAEKRRELKEKKEQEERDRQDRVRLAKIEQAKREEEARRMFEEAAAAAEEEKELEAQRVKEREEEERRQLEEEKRKEEEANVKKREAAEKAKRDRELQKQKQEDERMARKKRLEMIMRRTRQPDANSDSSKPKTDDSSSPLGTPSPQQSPASGRSPQTESPVGGKSPLTIGTPERSVSPAIAAILHRSTDSLSTIQTPGQLTTESSVPTSNSEPNLLNFTNSATKYDSTGVELIKIDAVENVSQESNVEKPVPFEAFTQKNIVNGVETNGGNHIGSENLDPFNLFSSDSENVQQPNVPPINGNQDLLNLNTDTLQQKVLVDTLVPTGI